MALGTQIFSCPEYPAQLSVAVPQAELALTITCGTGAGSVEAMPGCMPRLSALITGKEAINLFFMVFMQVTLVC